MFETISVILAISLAAGLLAARKYRSFWMAAKDENEDLKNRARGFQLPPDGRYQIVGLYYEPPTLDFLPSRFGVVCLKDPKTGDHHWYRFAVGDFAPDNPPEIESIVEVHTGAIRTMIRC